MADLNNMQTWQLKNDLRAVKRQANQKLKEMATANSRSQADAAGEEFRRLNQRAAELANALAARR